MKRILVLSDSHRNLRLALKVIPAVSPDAIIHLGDTVADAEELSYLFSDIPVYYVRGNNDLALIDSEKVFEIFGKRFFCAHGHTLRLERGIERAKEEGCCAYLFGHTHVGFFEEKEELLVMNPGSISRPRDSAPSFGIIELEDTKIKGCVCSAVNY